MLGYICIEETKPGNNLPHFWHSWQDFKINKCKGNFMKKQIEDRRKKKSWSVTSWGMEEVTHKRYVPFSLSISPFKINK